MPEVPTVRIKGHKAGEYLIVNQSEFDPEKQKLFDPKEEPSSGAPDERPLGAISPATIVGDNEVVLPRRPHPDGLVPPAPDGRPPPPKAKVGSVVGMEGGHEVRSQGPALGKVGPTDESSAKPEKA
jgi:hypothetical protein